MDCTLCTYLVSLQIYVSYKFVDPDYGVSRITLGTDFDEIVWEDSIWCVKA